MAPSPWLADSHRAAGDVPDQVTYGPNGGWNHRGTRRVWFLELLAAKTGDGLYRYAAHKLMNYALYQQPQYMKHRFLRSSDAMALAWLFADESIEPVPPEAGSRIVYRNEILRVRTKEAGQKYLGPLDPAPDRGHVCTERVLTDTAFPSKLCLRSGWDPGDFYVLVDLYPTDHFPTGQAPGILGMTRWGAALGLGLDSKNASYDELHAIKGAQPLKNLPYDLLVYFAPQPGWRLEVLDRMAVDPRTFSQPAQLRYVWRGVVQAGRRRHVTQVYYPHAPEQTHVLRSSVPGTITTEGLAATAGAAGIGVVVDTPEVTVLRLSLEPDRVEWVVRNSGERPVETDDLATDARYLYMDVRQGRVRRLSAVAASFLRVDDQDIFRHAEPQDVDR